MGVGTDIYASNGRTEAGLIAGCARRIVPVAAVLVGAILPLAGCGTEASLQLPNEADQPVDTDRFELVARIAHITDAQLIDEESPGRLTAFAGVWPEAWRPHAAYSTQLLDGMIRTVNKLHVARHTFDFLVHTGDACDNAQANELEWFMTAFDGGTIDPLTGPDDRDPADLPDPLLDPHQPFVAQGLYRHDVHGDAPTIPWYSLAGNHDRFGNGVFPIVAGAGGRRIAPLPDDLILNPFLPKYLDPVGTLAWAPSTPANPGPPPQFSLAEFVTPNPHRRFITDREFVAAHLDSVGEPPGHGFDSAHPERTWYSVSPVPGLRLIALNSATPAIPQSAYVFSEGAISFEQRQFLERELAKAQAADEWVIVATHHPSGTLEVVYGTSLGPNTFRRLLNSYSCVKVHLSGHAHSEAVIDRGGYVEFVTSSILDAPQQGRVIELWRDGDQIELRYRSFWHTDVIEPPNEARAPMFDDPLMPMRRVAAELAGGGR